MTYNPIGPGCPCSCHWTPRLTGPPTPRCVNQNDPIEAAAACEKCRRYHIPVFADDPRNVFDAGEGAE